MLMEPKNDHKRGGLKFVNIMRILKAITFMACIFSSFSIVINIYMRSGI